MVKSAAQWLSEYGESHKNPTNIAIHKICVPAIMFSVLGFLWSVQGGFFQGLLNPAILVSLGVVFYYARMSIPLSVGMLIEATLMNSVLWALSLQKGFSIPLMSLVIFVVAWILQFIGHKIEGKKPSFFQDLVFLLIGPLWTLSFFYKKLGIKI